MLGTVLRSVLTALLVLATLTGPAAAADAVELAGTTVLTGDEGGRVVVELVREATIDLSQVSGAGGMRPSAVRIRGGKGFVGFVLTQRGNGRRLSVLALKTPHKVHDGDDVVSISGHGQISDGDSVTPCVVCRMPRGEYDLQLVTDSVRAKVVLRLDGLSGRVRLRPTTEVRTTTSYPGTWTRPTLLNGGGTEMGSATAGPSSQEDGWVIGAYSVTVDADPVPLARTELAACLTAAGQRLCDNAELVGGSVSAGAVRFVPYSRGDSSAGSGLSWHTTGRGTISVDHSLVAIPLL